jgi:SpoVK/Ycf46/Vps4 family AAA+-type ATPase
MIESYEQALRENPFNIDTRIDYLNALLAEGFHDTFDVQLTILHQASLNDDQINLLENIVAKKTAMTSQKVPGLSVIDGNPEKRNVVAFSRQQSQSVRFTDIVGMKEVKKKIKRQIIDPFLNPGLFQRFNKKTGGGIMLYGPPGCGKTLIAKAIASECKATFINVGISDVISAYHGESESRLAAVFNQARSSAPSVLFIDELDALAFSRSKSQTEHSRRLVNELLTQLDGLGKNNQDVLVLGATNMPWDVDDATKRPGRFDRMLFVPPLDEEAITELLVQRTVNLPVDKIDYSSIAKACRNYSGADVEALLERAKDEALDAAMDSGIERNICREDFLTALDDIHPSTEDWFQTARNLVKYGNAGKSYADLEKYLKKQKLY